MSEVKCVICGKVIETPRKNAKCCSAECSRKYHVVYSRKYMSDRYEQRYSEDEEFREKRRVAASNYYAKKRTKRIADTWMPHIVEIRKVLEGGGSDDDVLEYIINNVKMYMKKDKNA